MSVSLVRFCYMSIMMYALNSWKYKCDKVSYSYKDFDFDIPATYESECEYMKRTISDKSTIAFHITADGIYCGVVKLHHIGNGAAEMSYYIFREDMKCRGIATEATSQCIDYAFNKLGLDMIVRYIHNNNIPSVKLSRKQGFWCAGRSFEKQDVNRFEITKTKWMSQKKNA